MRKLAAFSGIVALAAWLGACGSSSTTGTETLAGTLGGAAAASLLNSNSNVAISFHTFVLTGPVNTTAHNISLGHQANGSHTFSTPDGNLVLNAKQKTSGQQNPTVTGKTGNTCHFKLSGGTGTYTVDGSKSTGSFAGATGSGSYNINLVAAANLLPGKTSCSASNDTGNVLSAGAAITFKASGPLTVKS
jgi:hypothetical protein